MVHYNNNVKKEINKIKDNNIKKKETPVRETKKVTSFVWRLGRRVCPNPCYGL